MGNEVKPTTEGWKPAATQEEEEQRFGKLFEGHMSKFLEEPETPEQPKDGKTVTPPTSPAPPQSPQSLSEAINAALDAREKNKSKDEELGKLRTDVDFLKSKQPKPRRWFDPFTLFSEK